MADILCLIVMFKGEGSLNLYYEITEDANKAYVSLCNARMEPAVTQIADNFGTRATVDGAEIRAIIMQNMQRHMKAVVEVQMLNGRTQAALQKQMAADPTMRFLGTAGAANGMLRA